MVVRSKARRKDVMHDVNYPRARQCFLSRSASSLDIGTERTFPDLVPA